MNWNCAFIRFQRNVHYVYLNLTYATQLLTCSFRDFSIAFSGSRELTDSLKWERGPAPAAYSPPLGVPAVLKSYGPPRLELYGGGPLFIMEPLAIPEDRRWRVTFQMPSVLLYIKGNAINLTYYSYLVECKGTVHGSCPSCSWSEASCCLGTWPCSSSWPHTSRHHLPSAMVFIYWICNDKANHSRNVRQTHSALINTFTLMPCMLLLAGFQLAAASIVTSSTSELLSVLRIPHMYWSTSKPSSWAGRLQKIGKL